jgi:hypothetical protein
MHACCHITRGACQTAAPTSKLEIDGEVYNIEIPYTVGKWEVKEFDCDTMLSDERPGYEELKPVS